MISADSLKQDYADNGYCFPIDVFSADRAARYRAQLEDLEAKLGDTRVGNKDQLNFPHVIFRFAAEIVQSPEVLDKVEEILGPDILVWGSTFFIKEPHTDGYVSWHQDLRYWGLEDEEGMVSAWLALSPVTIANGCMRFVPGSHKNALVGHRDTFQDDNILTRGQEADVEIDEAKTVQVELKPGQMSLHHGRLLHASAPNGSDERRVGFTMNFIKASNRQVVAERDFAMLVRGEDKYRHFDHVPAPDADLSADAIAWHARILDAQNAAMYDGAAQGPT